MKWITRKFFRNNPVNTPSALCISYAIITGEIDFDAEKMLREADEVLQARVHEITQMTDTSALLRMARQSRRWLEKSKILERLLELESEVSDELKKRLLTSQVDEFIELATHFLVLSKYDVTAWILENYASVRNQYTQSCLCLVLGFRATPDVVPFLLDQFEIMRYWDDELWHGPVLGLEQLNERFSLV